MLRDQERFDLVAHFPSAEKAKTAEEAFGGHVEQESAITFGLGSWVGLGTGVAAGVVVGLFLYRNLLGIGFLPAIMSQRGPLVTALWAAILGASGWIIGTTMHLFSSTPGADRFELHITIQAEKLTEIRKLLVAEGATAISIRERRAVGPAPRTAEHGHARNPVHEHGN